MRFLLVFLFSAVAFCSKGQNASLYGTISDQEDNELIPFANVVLHNDSGEVGLTTSDFNGQYKFTALDSGKFWVSYQFVGYRKKVINNITIAANEQVEVNVQMEMRELACPFYFVNHPFLFEKDDASNKTTFTREDIQRMPF